VIRRPEDGVPTPFLGHRSSRTKKLRAVADDPPAANDPRARVA
jgi:hypothetical protein